MTRCSTVGLVPTQRKEQGKPTPQLNRTFLGDITLLQFRPCAPPRIVTVYLPALRTRQVLTAHVALCRSDSIPSSSRRDRCRAIGSTVSRGNAKGASCADTPDCLQCEAAQKASKDGSCRCRQRDDTTSWFRTHRRLVICEWRHLLPLPDECLSGRVEEIAEHTKSLSSPMTSDNSPNGSWMEGDARRYRHRGRGPVLMKSSVLLRPSECARLR
ncbi:hypothetical protein EDD15DRAFT_1463207 [Pisolithus albus]|nr:hypothetical protein EDD15DRAFT_1463207 [Pisolithus albus]